MLQERKEEYCMIHSDVESFFQELRESGEELPLVERGLNPVAEGCYTSQIRVKQKHRLLENEIYSGEKDVFRSFPSLWKGIPCPGCSRGG